MELVLLIGLQGSGKSSFYRERFAATHLHEGFDVLFQVALTSERGFLVEPWGTEDESQ